jgi:ribulose 1,5-bisphosphate synthetase/thiazole synthase
MKDHPKQTVSVWMDSGPLVKESLLTKDARADVCIVGAGIAGMTTAYLLSKEGKSVIDPLAEG